MSEFLGSRISLISKSDIRYSGILHEINSEESTVSLENVRSYGTEGRRGNPEEELPASDQVYEYIVFRGSDVKDLRIEEGPGSKENKPPTVPDDPAIVGPRWLSVAVPATTWTWLFPPPGPGAWGGRGGPGPVPDPRFAGMHYPPPPGWFPPGQGFPPGPGPWNNFGYPPGPHGPPGAPGAPGAPGQGMRGTPQQDNKPTPIGAGPGAPPGIERPKPAGTPQQGEAASEQKAPTQLPPGSAPAPTPPVESKPSVEEVRATAQSLNNNGPAKVAQQQKNVPTGPRNNNRVTPAVPFTGAQKAGPSGQSAPQITAAAASIKPASTGNAPASAASIRDATQQAKDAVAVAMAKLGNASATPGAGQPAANGTGNAMDNLTKKVNEMRVNATTSTRGGPSGRGRGRGNRAGGAGKIDVPETDFDFQVANAKFNKQDLVKEAIAGSPLGETPNGPGLDPEVEEADEEPAPAQAYNKTRSFFDNISSESKERSESGGQKPGGREWRGEEQRKNMETFGQGSVDGGYRSYRGRGRGRGRGGPRGGGRGFSRGGFRPRGGEAQGPAQ
ncbi:Scd6-like Sm domain-containing protein [Apiospora saccharicola]